MTSEPGSSPLFVARSLQANRSPLRLKALSAFPDPEKALWSKKACGLFSSSLERTDERSGFQFVGEQDHLLAGLSELFAVIVDDAPELRLQGCGFLALAIRPTRDRPDHSTMLCLPQLFRHRLLQAS